MRDDRRHVREQGQLRDVPGEQDVRRDVAGGRGDHDGLDLGPQVRERVELALGLLSERYQEGRSGIVLETVAGGWAFRASREAAEACGRLFERPVQRGLSQAALETLAIVAYLGPCTRPEIARIRGVAADSAVAGLVERGLITEAGRDDGTGGAVRYRTTPMFERVFGLVSFSIAAMSASLLPRMRNRFRTAATAICADRNAP